MRSGTTIRAAFNCGGVTDTLKNLMKTLALLSRKKKAHIHIHNCERTFLGSPDPLEPICVAPLGKMNLRLRTLPCFRFSPNHPQDGPCSPR